MFKELAARGFARKEPPDATIRIEKPRLFRKIAELVYGVPLDPKKLTVDFALPPAIATSIVAAHADRSELVATVQNKTPDNVVKFPQG